MVITTSPTKNLVTDSWVKASWEEFIAFADDSDCIGRFYYDSNYMRIEMASVGSSHGRQNSIISKFVSLYATFNNLEVVEFINTSFRKKGMREFQPDLSFYIGSDLRIPPETNSPVDLDIYDPPTLVIEIGATSVNDDLGRKRLLYERSGVQEYWVDDAKERQIIAFLMTEGGSKEIRESIVLPGLSIDLVDEALKLSKVEKDARINRWLIETFSQSKS